MVESILDIHPRQSHDLQSRKLLMIAETKPPKLTPTQRRQLDEATVDCTCDERRKRDAGVLIGRPCDRHLLLARIVRSQQRRG